MNLHISKIDYTTASIAEIEAEIGRLERIREEYFNTEQSIKIFINSCYGACASPFYECYNINVAEATTLQGQDMIKFTNDVLDEYFLKEWHLDKDLHDKLGLTKVEKITNSTTVVYNDTDSVDKDTIIHTSTGDKRIEDWYNENMINGSAGVTTSGHESVKTNDTVLNWTSDNGLHQGDVGRIIRHKVSKPKWEIKTKSGKEVIITNDHSMVVFRDGEQLTVKPCEILMSDKILCIKKSNSQKQIEYYFDDIEVCGIIGGFENEYVYDIEMVDESHTFIANEMLVHNSTYISFNHALESCDWSGSPTEFVLAMNKHRIQDYLDECFGAYAKKYNTKNLQKLELEKISHSALMVAKKKYILELAWKEPNVFYAPLEKIKPTGIEIVQGQTPKFVRKTLKEVINLIFEKNTSLTYMDVVNKMREYKKQFVLQSPDDISKTVSIGDYEKFILKDKETVIVGPHCPIHVKAAGIYNHELMKSKWKTKYELIKTGDKCKYFYTTNNCGVFAFLPKNYPVEFGYPIDYDTQFNKTVISPVNKYIKALNFNPIPPNLVVPTALF